MKTRVSDTIASFYFTFIAPSTRGQRAPLSRRAGQFATDKSWRARSPLMARSCTYVIYTYVCMHNVFLKVRQTHAILTYVTRARVSSGGLVPKTFVSQVATWTRSTKHENDFSYSCKFRLREREKRERERETAASNRNKSASSRCNAKRVCEAGA